MSEQDIFLAAIEIADPQARSAYLDEACCNKLEFRQQIEALLKAHAAAENFLNTPALQQLPAKSTAIDSQSALPSGSMEFDKTHGYAQPPSESSESVSLNFLSPSDTPGSLGRLGHYEVHEVLGHGAFGIVLKAFDEKLHRLAAIKVLTPELAATSPPRKRFLREARAAAAIRHENVVSVYAVEELPTPYLVMEYIPGMTLQHALNGHGPLDVADVLRLGQQIAAGLAAAHAQGLIHRDIKPTNILLENGLGGRVKITDFGLARAADDASLTQSGTIAGTPMYMSPEQATTGKIDQRSDLFSLGSVLYVMACGRPPFRAANTLAVLKRVVEDTPRPISEIIADVPTWLCAIIAKLQAKKPEDRFATAQDVADLLGRCLADLKANRPVTLPEGIQVEDENSAESAAPVNRPSASVPQSVIPQALAPRHSRTASRRLWPTIASVAFILLVVFSITEATGVTQLTSTVIRLTTGSGTLVIQTDDPGVKVTIDGEEVQIQGAGVEQLTLKPGQYKVAAVKDGKPVSQELVTITRGGKQVVRVTMEGIANVDSPVSRNPKGSAPITDDPDRGAAEWALSLGGTITIRGSAEERVIQPTQKLPPESFQLTQVTLDHNERLKDAGLSPLKGLTNLITLRLDGSPLTDADLSPLASLENLAHLNLQATGVIDNSIECLKDLSKMEHLAIHDNPQLGNNALNYLVRMSELKRLDLRGTQVGDAGLQFLKQLPNLFEIVLIQTQVSDRGLETLTEFSKLSVLQLQNTMVTDAGLIHLTKLPTLRFLLLNDTKVTESGVKKLAAALPKCRIEWDGGVIEPRETHDEPTPSPLDALDPSRIPMAERFDWQPKELVAMFGSQAHRHWGRDFPPGYCLTVSPDGAVLATGGGDCVLRLWEADTLQLLGTLDGLKFPPISLRFSPDGKRLLGAEMGAGQQETIHLWNVITRQKPKDYTALVGDSAYSGFPYFGPDGRPMAALTDWGGLSGKVVLYDLEARKVLQELNGHAEKSILLVDVHPAGTQIATSDPDAVRLWDAATGARLHQWSESPGPEARVRFSPDGKRLAAKLGKQPEAGFIIWDVETKEPVLKRTAIHTHYCMSLAFSPDGKQIVSGGRHAAAGPEHDFLITDIASGETVGRIPSPRFFWDSPYFEAVFCQDRARIATFGMHYGIGGDGVLRIYDTATGEPQSPLTAPPFGPTRFVALAPDLKSIFSIGGDGVARIWSLEPGVEPMSFDTQPYSTLRFNPGWFPDGERLLMLENAVRLRDRQGKVLSTLPQQPTSAAVLGDGKTVVFGQPNGFVEFYDFEKRPPEKRKSFLAHEDDADMNNHVLVALSPDERRLLTAGEHRAKVWDLSGPEPELVHTLGQAGTAHALFNIYEAIFAPDGGTVALARENRVEVWDVASPQAALVQELFLDARKYIHAIAYDPTGEWLAAADVQGQVKVWNTHDWSTAFEWTFPGQVHDLQFAADGRHLVTGNSNGTIYVLRLAKANDKAPGTASTQHQLDAGSHNLPADSVSSPDMALDFNGKTACVRIPTFFLENASPLTLECWVKPRRILRNQPVIRVYGEHALGIFLGQGHITTNSFLGNQPYGIHTPWSENDLRWRHVAAVWDGQEFRLYLDGRRSGTTFPTRAKSHPFQLTVLGLPPVEFQVPGDPPDAFDGLLDEIRISRVARYTADFTPPTRHLLDDLTLALYHCDEPSPSQLTDSSAGKHHGELTDVQRGASNRGREIDLSSASAPKPAIAPFDAEQAKKHQETWAKYLGVPVEYTNSIGMKFRLIPPGEFQFGSTPEESQSALMAVHPDYLESSRPNFDSESPQHRVKLTQPFYLGVTEVRQQDFEAILKRNPSYFSPNGPAPSRTSGMNPDLLPVDTISWTDAAEFCQLLSEQESLKPSYSVDGENVVMRSGNGYSLPTEFQWEFACRAGTETQFASGNTEDDLKRIGWYFPNAGQNVRQVAQLAPNPFGLYDMHGNLSEWTHNQFDQARNAWPRDEVIDPVGGDSPGLDGCLRGGNWDDGWPYCRSASRGSFVRTSSNYRTGFRVVMSVQAVRKLRPVSD